jgi:stage III sporulation protein AB
VPAVVTLLGAACVLGGCGGWGLLVARQLQRRPREIAGVATALERLRTEIEYGRVPLGPALRRAGSVADGPAAALCLGAAELLSTAGGEGPAAAWEAALRAAESRSAWAAPEVAALAALGTALGASDAPDQVRHLRLCLGRLRAAEAEAAAAASRQARMWTYLGLLGGAALVLLAW